MRPRAHHGFIIYWQPSLPVTPDAFPPLNLASSPLPFSFLAQMSSQTITAPSCSAFSNSIFAQSSETPSQVLYLFLQAADCQGPSWAKPSEELVVVFLLLLLCGPFSGSMFSAHTATTRKNIVHWLLLFLPDLAQTAFVEGLKCSDYCHVLHHTAPSKPDTFPVKQGAGVSARHVRWSHRCEQKTQSVGFLHFLQNLQKN